MLRYCQKYINSDNIKDILIERERVKDNVKQKKNEFKEEFKIKQQLTHSHKLWNYPIYHK